MFTMDLIVNGQNRTVNVASDTPLLWVLRDNLGLTGTKFGCVLPVAAAQGQQITTIEGLSNVAGGGVLHAVQQAWIDEQVPQCGYCQSGMLMAAAALLSSNSAPSNDAIDAAMTNICRCGTYQRVRAGIHKAAKALQLSRLPGTES